VSRTLTKASSSGFGEPSVAHRSVRQGERSPGVDPEQADATDLATAYAQRWEIENTFDELKTHQRGPRAVLRSKSPELVQQEIWGHLCCHYAIRTLMLDAATHHGHDPDRISFVAALRITRRSLSHSSFSPSQP
jgi:hypothetical protein